MAKSSGKLFEEEIQTSCKEQKIWFFRVRDVKLPPDIRIRVKVPENPYDALIYRDGYLFPLEMKSTKGKSLPFKNIKEHQIESLKEANIYDEKIIPGFLINFRDHEKTFFLHIDQFIKYHNIIKSGIKEIDGCKVNVKSIPIEICDLLGIQVNGVIKKVKYRWYINQMIDKLIKIK